MTFREPADNDDMFIEKCLRCGSEDLRVGYYMPKDEIVSLIQCLECNEKFYEGALGESEWKMRLRYV